MNIDYTQRRTAMLDGVKSITIEEFATAWAQGKSIKIYKFHPINLIIVGLHVDGDTLLVSRSEGTKNSCASLMKDKEFVESLYNALMDARNHGSEKPQLVMTTGGEVLLKIGGMNILDHNLKSAGPSNFVSAEYFSDIVMEKLFLNINENTACLVIVDGKIKMAWAAVSQMTTYILAGHDWINVKTPPFDVDAWVTIALSSPKVYDVAKALEHTWHNHKRIIDAMKKAVSSIRKDDA